MAFLRSLGVLHGWGLFLFDGRVIFLKPIEIDIVSEAAIIHVNGATLSSDRLIFGMMHLITSFVQHHVLSEHKHSMSIRKEAYPKKVPREKVGNVLWWQRFGLT